MRDRRGDVRDGLDAARDVAALGLCESPTLSRSAKQAIYAAQCDDDDVQHDARAPRGTPHAVTLSTLRDRPDRGDRRRLRALRRRRALRAPGFVAGRRAVHRARLPGHAVRWDDAAAYCALGRRTAADRGRVGVRGARRRGARYSPGATSTTRTSRTTARGRRRPDRRDRRLRVPRARSARSPTARRRSGCSTWRATSPSGSPTFSRSTPTSNGSATRALGGRPAAGADTRRLPRRPRRIVRGRRRVAPLGRARRARPAATGEGRLPLRGGRGTLSCEESPA